MQEVVGGMKSPSNIIRRLSRGAHSRIGRRRTSTASSSRDQSAGPVIIRRRSNSNRLLIDTSQDVSDLELDSLDAHEEHAIEDSPLEDTRPSGLQSQASLAQTVSGDGIAPTQPAILQTGVWMTKFTKKRKKRLFFRLDFEAGKLYWDHQSSKQVYIDDIQSVRTGKETREFRESLSLPAESEPCFLTIAYSDQKTRHKLIHLLAGTPEIRDYWVDSLNRIQKLRIQKITDIVRGGEKSLEELWRKENKASKAEAGPRLEFSNIKNICWSLNINGSDITLLEQFNKADYNHCGKLDFEQFRYFMKQLLKRQDIKQVFKNIRNPGQRDLDLASFFAFLKNTQGIDVDAELTEWTKFFEKHCKRSKLESSSAPSGATLGEMTMTSAEFQDVMMLPKVTGDVSYSRTGEPLNRPFNEYFISSSHNTYLTGRQYFDASSTEAYTLALTKGCKCVEIDCWDGPDGLPQVKHGRGWTTILPFTDCLLAINESAFKASDYPVIISLEVHCSPPQQMKMAESIKEVFGEQLVLAPLNDSETLPSPEELKHRILIKVKACSEDIADIHKSFEAALPRNQRITSPITVPVRPGSLHSATSISSPPPFILADDLRISFAARDAQYPPAATPISPSSSGEESDVEHDMLKKKVKSNIIKPLSDLGIYAKGIKFRNFRSPEAKTYNHIFSLAEDVFDKSITRDKEVKTALERHNRRYLMRLYPGAFRITSNNFNPLRYWRRGVQMCAMNWQVYDHGMQLNRAMFAAGDDWTGYVLKPAELRPSDSLDAIPFQKPSKRRVKFTIDVISAQRLPRPRGLPAEAKMNPFVTLEVFTADDKEPGQRVASVEGGFSHPSDTASTSKRTGGLRKVTKIVPNNGYDPNFREHFSLKVDTRYPSLVFVRCTVFNSPDGKTTNTSEQNRLASYTVKLDSLQAGYRHFPLFNKAYERFYFSTLFCRVVKEPAQVIPDDISEIAQEQLLDASPESRPGILKKLFRQTSLRKRSNTPSQTPSVVSAATYPQTLSPSGTNTPSMRRVPSTDSSLYGMANPKQH
jgi:phosphatidylinositol phospholipase C, delta